ncbi:MAG: hypothetical protein LBT68_00645, partial [Spirochaetales bacterium]|nr:hypothetical protein [Spirochaetales bacterium]
MNKNDAPADSKFAGEIDPEIADLMGIEEPPKDAVPEFSDLVDEGIQEGEELGELRDDEKAEAASPRLKSFTRPAKIEGAPRPLFQDPNFYKIVLGGEGEIAQKIHTNFSAFMKSTDSQEKSQFRGRLIPAVWELLGGMAVKVLRKMAEPKKVFIRYGVLVPTMLAADQREMFSKVIWENNTGEPIFYVDEWLTEVARGNVSVSTQDEVKTSRKDDHQKMTALLERAKGKFDAQQNLIRGNN